jgi:hypothetical protein
LYCTIWGREGCGSHKPPLSFYRSVNQKRFGITSTLHSIKMYLIKTIVADESLNWLTMEQSPWEADSRSVSEEIPPSFMEPDGLSPCSQEPAAGPYPVPFESSSHPHTCHFKIILPFTPSFSKLSFPFQIFSHNILLISHLSDKRDIYVMVMNILVGGGGDIWCVLAKHLKF